MAQITLTAKATGFSRGMILLLNADDEAGILTVVLPSESREGSGLLQESGRIFLSEPARHDVLVLLKAVDARLEVPSHVVIPAGKLSQEFPLRVSNDSFVNPLSGEARVQAVTSGWPMAEGVILLIDDEYKSYSMTLPAAVVEGLPAAGTIRVDKARTFDTVFALTSSHSRLQVPLEITLPAGAFSVDFAMQAPDDGQTNGPLGVEICTQAQGLPGIVICHFTADHLTLLV